MTFEEIMTPQVATIAAAVFGGLITVQTTFIKWLVDRFDRLSSAIREQNTMTLEWLKDHEEKDQERHIDNLKRFEKISITLAKLGHLDGDLIHN